MALQLDSKQISDFQKTVLGYYRGHGRHDLPWRVADGGRIDPYKVLVSELMLQQTQVPRVLPKFLSFTAQFPSFAALAAAPLSEVLKAWSGLGYNRRAKFLWLAAQALAREHGGTLPTTQQELVRLPGVGPNTAGALLAYAYNRPVVFIETNVRTVYIHNFFADKEGIHDKEILDVVAATLPDDVRTWYWALMDYGTHLKQTVGNLNTLSKHYKKQSAFQGSRRQVRGQVLRVLGDGPQTAASLGRLISDERLSGVVEELIAEGLVSKARGRLMLYGAP